MTEVNYKELYEKLEKKLEKVHTMTVNLQNEVFNLRSDNAQAYNLELITKLLSGTSFIAGYCSDIEDFREKYRDKENN